MNRIHMYAQCTWTHMQGDNKRFIKAVDGQVSYAFDTLQHTLHCHRTQIAYRICHLFALHRFNNAFVLDFVRTATEPVKPPIIVTYLFLAEGSNKLPRSLSI
jgi:hypothetical protein